MIAIPELADAGARYANLPVEPLRVTCTLRPGGSVAGFEMPCLDGLLAGALVREVLAGRDLDDARDGYDIPLPLRCLWRDTRGLPLWAATPLRPVGLTAEDTVYCHKRQQPGTSTAHPKGRFVITPSMARYTERRIPVPTTVCAALEATCIGHAPEVARLLGHIASLGKRRNIGFNEVERWTIAPAEGWGWIDEDGRLARSLPAAAGVPLGVRGAGDVIPIGWTPPPWKPSLLLVGWPAGTEVTP